MTDEPRSLGGSTRFRDALIEDDPTELYENAPCGYVSLLPSGQIVKANRTFLDWTGYGAATLLTKRIHDLLAPGDRIFYETHLSPALTLQGSVREIAVDLRCSDERRLPVLLNAILVADESGQPAVTRIAVFDARERRTYEQQLLDARREAEAAAERASALAATLQRTLLPPSPPSIPGIDVGGAYRPAGDGSEVGGDFYDMFETAPGAWSVVIGDVCGKGARAAVVTALARYTIRAEAMRNGSPAGVLARLHDALLVDDADGFLTAVYLTARSVDPDIHVRITVAGHHLPLVVAPDGTVGPVGTLGHLLGILGPPVLHDVDLRLTPGETLVLTTDGVIEARNGDEFFGEERLRQLLAAHVGAEAQELADIVAGAAIDFQDGYPRDDIAVVTLRAPSR